MEMQVTVEDEVPKEEAKLADKLRSCCNDEGFELEATLHESASILLDMGRLYIEKAKNSSDKLQQKLNFIKSAALISGAKVRFCTLLRNPNKKDLAIKQSEANAEKSQETGQMFKIMSFELLKLCKAQKPDTDLLQISDRVSKWFSQFRKKENEFIEQYLPRIDDKVPEPAIRKMEKEKIVSIKNILKKNTTRYKDAMKYISQQCIEILGDPPCKFALIGLGSLSREEITLYSDFEHAILLEDGIDDSPNGKIREYFRWYSVIFQVIIIGLGETYIPTVGVKSLNDLYSDDKTRNWFFDRHTPGGVSCDGKFPHACKTPLGRHEATKNKRHVTELIQPVHKMLKYLTAQEDLKNGYHLRDVLMRTCLVHGDEDLHKIFKDETRLVLTEVSSDQAVVEQAEFLAKNRIVESRIFRHENILNILGHDIKKAKDFFYRPISVLVGCMSKSFRKTTESNFAFLSWFQNAFGEEFSTDISNLEYALAVAVEIRLKSYSLARSQKQTTLAGDILSFVSTRCVTKCATAIQNIALRFQLTRKVKLSLAYFSFAIFNVKFELFQNAQKLCSSWHIYGCDSLEALSHLSLSVLEYSMPKSDINDGLIPPPGMNKYIRKAEEFLTKNNSMETFEYVFIMSHICLLEGRHQKGLDLVEKWTAEFRKSQGNLEDTKYISLEYFRYIFSTKCKTHCELVECAKKEKKDAPHSVAASLFSMILIAKQLAEETTEVFTKHNIKEYILSWFNTTPFALRSIFILEKTRVELCSDLFELLLMKTKLKDEMLNMLRGEGDYEPENFDVRKNENQAFASPKENDIFMSIRIASQLISEERYQKALDLLETQTTKLGKEQINLRSLHYIKFQELKVEASVKCKRKDEMIGYASKQIDDAPDVYTSLLFYETLIYAQLLTKDFVGAKKSITETLYLYKSNKTHLPPNVSDINRNIYFLQYLLLLDETYENMKSRLENLFVRPDVKQLFCSIFSKLFDDDNYEKIKSGSVNLIELLFPTAYIKNIEKLVLELRNEMDRIRNFKISEKEEQMLIETDEKKRYVCLRLLSLIYFIGEKHQKSLDLIERWTSKCWEHQKDLDDSQYIKLQDLKADLSARCKSHVEMIKYASKQIKDAPDVYTQVLFHVRLISAQYRTKDRVSAVKSIKKAIRLFESASHLPQDIQNLSICIGLLQKYVDLQETEQNDVADLLKTLFEKTLLFEEKEIDRFKNGIFEFNIKSDKDQILALLINYRKKIKTKNKIDGVDFYAIALKCLLGFGILNFFKVATHFTDAPSEVLCQPPVYNALPFAMLFFSQEEYGTSYLQVGVDLVGFFIAFEKLLCHPRFLIYFWLVEENVDEMTSRLRNCIYERYSEETWTSPDFYQAMSDFANLKQESCAKTFWKFANNENAEPQLREKSCKLLAQAVIMFLYCKLVDYLLDRSSRFLKLVSFPKTSGNAVAYNKAIEMYNDRKITSSCLIFWKIISATRKGSKLQARSIEMLMFAILLIWESEKKTILAGEYFFEISSSE